MDLPRLNAKPDQFQYKLTDDSSKSGILNVSMFVFFVSVLFFKLYPTGKDQNKNMKYGFCLKMPC